MKVRDSCFHRDRTHLTWTDVPVNSESQPKDDLLRREAVETNRVVHLCDHRSETVRGKSNDRSVIVQLTMSDVLMDSSCWEHSKALGLWGKKLTKPKSKRKQELSNSVTLNISDIFANHFFYVRCLRTTCRNSCFYAFVSLSLAIDFLYVISMHGKSRAMFFSYFWFLCKLYAIFSSGVFVFAKSQFFMYAFSVTIVYVWLLCGWQACFFQSLNLSRSI